MRIRTKIKYRIMLGTIIAIALTAIITMSLSYQMTTDIIGHNTAQIDQLNDMLTKILLITIAVAICLLIIAWYFVGVFLSPIQQVTDSLLQFTQGNGNLSLRLEENDYDEAGELAIAFNKFIHKIQSLINDVAKSSSELHIDIDTVKTLSQNSAKNVEEQRTRTLQVVTAIEQITVTITEIASNANDVSTSTAAGYQETQQGQQVVHNSINTMQQLAVEIEDASSVINSLAQSSKEIGSILEVIKGISEQTNLLALNAAIEAARAGEQGRGFAVVADEVRTLAQRTNESTNEIQKMITQLQNNSAEAVNAIDRGSKRSDDSIKSISDTGEHLNLITENMTTISDLSTLVATATEEQSVVIGEINQNVIDINDISDKTAQDSQTTAAACERLQQSSLHLERLISQFES
ncbi:HAMP domain-containing methyl-accepting chemotaxis protein [Moritella sp.]|uniref:methyl-accepting chemotaxis protein n=1 Tax=Moritella sp. TaxID=78556 RepID=UPI001D766160|nr:HAMP domain-containing methyl-accepting chemotaxis protein [Moritella sp.]MCJ8348001.1 methyl-accepting chemotaxis protein [Moritella sp.]NQZ40326.1 methyl-accepting chemotaxis protein [Moritella sp.]